MKLTHTVLSRHPTRYHSFPDVVKTPSGRLIAVFRDADGHVANESRLMITHSDDSGATWTVPAVLDPVCGHMPRISLLPDNSIVILDDGAPPNHPQGKLPHVRTRLFRSADDGETFHGSILSPGTNRDVPECPTFAPDRILTLSDTEWITLGQVRLGNVKMKHSFVNFVYRTTDGGRTWGVEEIASCDLIRKITEPSMTKMPDGSILAVYRDNQAGAPSRWNTADGDGRNWTELNPAPFCGQRPTVGVLSDGRLLVTYRKTNAPHGTAAWLGTAEQLAAGDGSGEFMLMPIEKGIGLGDMGYSGWVELEPGVIYAVYHHADEPGHSYVRGVKIELDK